LLRPPDRATLQSIPTGVIPINAQAVEALIEKLKSLPAEQRAEVEDFVDFLKARKERARDAAAQRLGEAFKKLDALNQTPPTPEEVQAEIDAARAELQELEKLDPKDKRQVLQLLDAFLERERLKRKMQTRPSA
jgi:superfamily I DNA/RNA helicase